MNFQRRIALLLFAAVTASSTLVHAAEDTPIARGEEFLASMFDAEASLLPEYRGSKIYWLFHDNYLAAHWLDRTRPDLGRRIRSTLERFGVTNSGKIEIVFGEARSRCPSGLTC